MIAAIRRFVLMVALIAFTASAAGAVQTQVMVQGYLTNSSGTPYTTSQTAEFRVYQGGNSATAGSGVLYYDETASVSPSGSGVFNYALGSGSPTVPFLVVGGGATVPNVLSPTTFDTTQPVYLEISVGGFALLPRLQLLGTPYATLATTAENLKPTSAVVTNSLVASYVVINTTGTSQYSVTTSTGIKVLAGSVDAPAFNGTYYGDGSKLSGVGAASVGASNVAPGLLGAGVQLPAGSLVNGPLSAAILPSTVAYTSAPNTFVPSQAFAGGLTASTGVFTNGLTAATAALTATGQYSLTTSSGIKVLAGSVDAPAFNGTYYGDGSKLSGVGAASVAATSVTPGTLGAGVQLPAGSLVNGPLAAGVLPSTVAYTSSANTFVPPQFFSGGLSASAAVLSTGLTAASATLTAVGNSQYSLTTSSGINVLSGMVSAPAFSGAFVGDGSRLSGVGAANVAASAVTPGTFGASVQLQAGSLVNGPLAAGILPSTVAYTSSANTFVPPQTFSGGLSASAAVLSTSLTAASATLTAVGNSQYSLTTSSGINVLAGMVSAPAFSGAFVGDGSRLSGVGAANVAASAVTPGTFGAGVQLQAGSLVNGPVAAGVLPSTVAYTSSANTFWPLQTFSGGILASALEVASVGPSMTRLGGVYSGPTSGYSGIGQETSRHTVAFRSWSNVVPDTLGAKIVAINKTAYPSMPWYLAQTTELHFSILKAGALTSDDTFDALQLTPAGLNAVDGLSTPKGVTAAAGTFTATGNTQYSVTSSSGIKVLNGSVDAPAFNGTYYGDGSKLAGVTATSVAAGSVQAGQLGSGVQLQAGSLVNGPVAAGILPSSVPFTTVSNVFIPPQAFPGGLTASSGTFLNGVTAASGTFSATGQYSLSTSSGIKVLAGSVDAPAFNGTYYGDGSKLSGISPGTPVGTIVLFAGTSEPSGWVECDGRSLGQSGTAVASWGNYSTAALFGAIGTVWGSAGAGVYNLPDFRGIVPRGYNHGKTGSWSDPDAGSRVAQYASGATGDAIGTYQLDELKSHTHSLSFTASGADSNSGGPNYNTTGANQPTSATGGNETRPKNASVLYIVRVQ
jgi:microcystin-dependent protein